MAPVKTGVRWRYKGGNLSEPRVVVIQLSEAFSQFLRDLVKDLGAAAEIEEASVANGQFTGAAAVLLAAGGTEREAVDWLTQNQVPLDVPLLVVGADGNRRTVAQLIGRGAQDYFALPDDVEVLRNALGYAVEQGRQALARREQAASGTGAGAFAEIVGESGTIKELLVRARRLLPHAKASVLILGDTGTGKELLARALHNGGPRQDAPFVAVNCSALPDNLVESELFGHERGAFTDAHAAKPGLFEVAQGGTLFLDEVGELPLALQAKLLRALDEREIRRVGGTKPIAVDLRVIAATNVDLELAVESGTFRRDLFHRLGVVTLSLPPLRARGDDAILIAQALLKRLASEHEVAVPVITDEVRQRLMECSWPGNVRELKNALERALLLSDDGTLNVAELRADGQSQTRSNGQLLFPANLDDIISSAIQLAMERCDGNRSASARLLGITRKRLKRILGGSDQGNEAGEAEPTDLPRSGETIAA